MRHGRPGEAESTEQRCRCLLAHSPRSTLQQLALPRALQAGRSSISGGCMAHPQHIKHKGWSGSLCLLAAWGLRGTKAATGAVQPLAVTHPTCRYEGCQQVLLTLQLQTLASSPLQQLQPLWLHAAPPPSGPELSLAFRGESHDDWRYAGLRDGRLCRGESAQGGGRGRERRGVVHQVVICSAAQCITGGRHEVNGWDTTQGGSERSQLRHESALLVEPQVTTRPHLRWNPSEAGCPASAH